LGAAKNGRGRWGRRPNQLVLLDEDRMAARSFHFDLLGVMSKDRYNVEKCDYL
jgi:MoxR-like ATPase